MCLFATLLILTQSFFAVDLLAPYFMMKDYNAKKAEVKQIVASKANTVEVATRIHLATFLIYWVATTFAVDIAAIQYHNCSALFVNTHSFNIYYTHLSALAP